MSMNFWRGRADNVEDELVDKLVREARKDSNFGGTSIYSQTDIRSDASASEYLVIVLTSEDENFHLRRNKVIEVLGMSSEQFEEECSQVPPPPGCIKFSSQNS